MAAVILPDDFSKSGLEGCCHAHILKAVSIQEYKKAKTDWHTSHQGQIISLSSEPLIVTLWNNLKFFPKRSLRRKEKRFSIKKLNSKQPQSRWREGGSSTNLLLTLSNSGANYLLNSFESRQAMTNGSGHNGSHSQGGIPNGKGMIISKMV